MPSPELFGPTRWRLPAGVTQLLGAVVGFGSGLVVASAHVGPTVQGSRVFDLLLTIGFGVLGLVSVLFSLLFLVVQWGSSMFTPRLLLFRNDPLIWQVFALAIGLFTYSLTAALVVDPDAPVSVAVPAVAMVLMLLTLAVMRTVQVRAFRSLQLAPTLAAIATSGLEIIARAYPRPYTSVPSARERDGEGRTVAWRGAVGVLQRLELPALVVKAERCEAQVEFTALVGDVLWPGKALAIARGDQLPDDAVMAAVVLGLERSFDQDPALAFRLLADIGLRALSSAINDPGTAVQVLDTIEPLLGDLGTRDLASTELYGASRRLRVTVPQPTWGDLITTSLDDIVVAAASVGSLMVLRRLIDLFANLQAIAPPERADIVVARLEQVKARAVLVDPFYGA